MKQQKGSSQETHAKRTTHATSHVSGLFTLLFNRNILNLIHVIERIGLRRNLKYNPPAYIHLSSCFTSPSKNRSTSWKKSYTFSGSSKYRIVLDAYKSEKDFQKGYGINVSQTIDLSKEKRLLVGAADPFQYVGLDYLDPILERKPVSLILLGSSAAIVVWK